MGLLSESTGRYVLESPTLNSRLRKIKVWPKPTGHTKICRASCRCFLACYSRPDWREAYQRYTTIFRRAPDCKRKGASQKSGCSDLAEKGRGARNLDARKLTS